MKTLDRENQSNGVQGLREFVAGLSSAVSRVDAGVSGDLLCPNVGRERVRETAQTALTQWFNRTLHCKGTLGEERVKSVLVEGLGPARSAMAAYIDRNPVRAGAVGDLEDYRWCGYAAAVGG